MNEPKVKIAPLQLDETAPWKQRFRAPLVLKTEIAMANPARGLAITDYASEALQLYAWDLPSGELRQLTHFSDGVTEGWISPNGQHLYYLQDEEGSEIGHVMRLPFKGGQPEDVTPDVPAYVLRGLGISRAGNLLALNPVNADGFQIYCLDLGPEDQLGPPRQLYGSQHEVWAAIPSHDGEMVACQSTERAGGVRRYSTLALDAASGETVGELWDGPEHSVEPVAFAPLPGDFRLLATTTLTGFYKPLIWNPHTGERIDLPLPELPGDVKPLDWSPDGRHILLNNLNQAVQQLYLYEPETGSLVRLKHPNGAFGIAGGLFGGAAYFTPQGEIFAHWQDATHPLQLIALDGETGAQTRTLLAAGNVPPGRPWRSISFRSSDGEMVQGWLATPEGRGPFPTLLTMHGGPHVVVTESFSPDSQAWLDHGFAYLTINFRGSTTFGRPFQEKIWGDLGHWELEDMAAARAWLIEQGIAHPDTVLLSGASYGGYLTLLGLGKQPELWAGGLALVAIADWVAAYEDASDALKGAFRAWFQGSPQEKAEQYRLSSPITYADQVQAPVLIVQGYNDTRTPARQVDTYEAQLEALDKPIEVIWFDAGHKAIAAELEIKFQEHMLRFAYAVLGQKEKDQ